MSSPVITVRPDTPVKEAARILVDNEISAMPVLDSNGRLVGIVSEADLMRIQTRPYPRSEPPPAGTVAEVITGTVLTLQWDNEVSAAARTMLEAGIKQMPVLRRNRLVGVVSRRDVMKVIARTDQPI